MGCYRPANAFKRLKIRSNDRSGSFHDNAFSWVNELIWRDFYQHLLVGFPRLSKNRAFRTETEALVWRNLPAEIDAWKAGRTGIPDRRRWHARTESHGVDAQSRSL